MRRPFSSMVLGAAMMTAAAMAAPLAAQNASGQGEYPLQLAVTYSPTHSDAVPNADFWMQGGSVELEGRFYRGLGMVADVGGMHAGNINSSGVGLDMVTVTFGPRYTWAPAHRRYEVFGQVLAGEANGFNSVFPTPGGAIDSSNSLALKMGGGMNFSMSPRFALRLFEADWVRTQLPNAGSNIQNNLSLGAGLVFRFR